MKATVPAWVRGASLKPETFRQFFFGPHGSPVLAAKAQTMGRALAQVRPVKDARAQGTTELADLVRSVGPDRFSHFLAQATAQATSASPLQNSRPHAFKPASIIPSSVIEALKRAMQDEGVPASERPSLEFIIAQESEGKVGVPNIGARSSATGLFQLTRAAWHYNPHGASSFGNAYEECVGGIRYIKDRFGTADRAEAYWRTHKHY